MIRGRVVTVFLLIPFAILLVAGAGCKRSETSRNRMSNGGFMCFRLACDAPDVIAAIAPVGALVGADLAKGNASTTPVSVLVILGTDEESSATPAWT